MARCLLVLAVLAVQALAAKCPAEISSHYPTPKTASGWAARVVANGLKHPRQIEFDQSGALLVTDEGVGVVRIVFEDHGGTCLAVKSKTTIVNDTQIGHGLALSKDTLYASTSNNVYSWPYSNGTLGERGTLVTNMTNSGHSSRTLLLSRDESTILVSRGSAGNIDPLALDKATGHCQIRQFSTKPDTQAFNFSSSGRLVGWGLRNSVGVAEHPDGGIWSVENSVDNLKRRGVDIHQDNPAEELNFHGKINDTAEGGNYGYPSCFALWGTSGVPDIGTLTTGDQFAADANASITPNAPTDAQCNDEFIEPVLALQAHTAPLDIKFDDTGNTAYISLHGSWNRDDKVGYAVSTVEFANGQPVAAHNSTSAVANILSNADVNLCPEKCFRPVGLAWDASGRLWMSSDTTGEIYVLFKGEDMWDAPVSSGLPLAPVGSSIIAAIVLALM